MLLSTLKIFPTQSPAYIWLGSQILPVALFLLIIGAPVYQMMILGRKALLALILGATTVFVGVLLSFFAAGPFLGEEGWKMSGALLGTWIGGSANMISVKEILQLSNKGMAPLIMADTFFSYGWMAFLIFGVVFQNVFDKGIPEGTGGPPEKWVITPLLKRKLNQKIFIRWLGVLLIGIAVGAVMMKGGGFLHRLFPILTGLGWTILLTSTVTVLMAATTMSKLENWEASRVGEFLLYLILASIGAQATLTWKGPVVAVFIFGFLTLVIHGGLLLLLGKIFRIPLYLLAISSQANIGGVVSAPIVAGIYRPGTAHIGALMAVFGALVGTYAGVFGGYLCGLIQRFF